MPPALAQQLQQLNVRAFTLASDTRRPLVERPFTVTLAVLLRSPAARLDNLYLPSFNGFEELGDERSVTTRNGATLYRETFRLVAHVRETQTIGPAYLDAIDQRDGKPKRFISNAVTLAVRSRPQLSPWPALRRAALMAAGIAVVAAAGIAAVSNARGRRKLRVRAPAASDYTAANAAWDVDATASALRSLHARRDRAAVSLLRSALWERVGAQDGETLRDVVGRAQPALRPTLVLVERAAFTGERDLQVAIADLLAQIDVQA